MEKQYYVYIMTNKSHSVLYTGVTSDLKKRVYQHQEKAADGFTQKYNVSKLVYYQIARNAFAAISREKQIKGGSRAKKIGLINGFNPEWIDLSETLYNYLIYAERKTKIAEFIPSSKGEIASLCSQ